ncbi:AraC family transcriptional regulator [Flavobacterium sp. ZS1P14]|uniref:AraC family transcriptional regulator n=1 Tax=Flavobacterium sp. ZS1P14 TaxID=3401729 RepID=UPI003AAFE643
MIKKYLLIVSLCLGNPVSAQISAFKIPDSIRNKDYNYLFDRIEESEKDSVRQSLYLHSFLFKAKSEKNSAEIINGYKNYVYHSSENLKLVYSDSMVYTAKKSLDNALIGSAYLTKGIVFYSQKKYHYALDNYLTANNFISKTNDNYLVYKVKYNIAQIKYYLGFYDEAISLFKECIAYYKNESTRPYLNSLHSLGLCYNKTGNYGLCTQTNKIGLTEGKRLNNADMDSYFIHSEGVNQYFNKKYVSAIRNITCSLAGIHENKDFANEAVGNFYIGKSYWALKKPIKALPYFHKVDQTFQHKGYMRPDLREVYELMIRYYKTTANSEIQLYYIDQLLKADHVINDTYKYLITKVNKEYDTKELLLEKKKIENLLDKRKYHDYLFTAVITLLLFSLVYLIHRHRKNQRKYKHKFEELMKKSEVITKAEVKNINTGVLDINQEAVAIVLKHLEKFERDKKFLEKDLTLVKLSASFDSNTKYLSKIIYHYRGKKFVEYLNDLKVDYLISLLKTEKILRSYTNKALAEKAGFSSTQRFANAFYSRTEISPSFFIQEIKKGLS